MKFSTVSDGSLICWPLVAACTPPPTPAPAAAPIAAPLPPPAMAPMMPPMIAPPPTFSAVFLPRELPCFLVLIGLQAVGLSARRKAVELQHDFRLPCKLARALYRHQVASQFDARGYGFFSIRGERSVQRGAKGFTRLIFLAVNRIDQAHRQLRSLIDDQLLRRRRRRRWGLRHRMVRRGSLLAESPYRRQSDCSRSSGSHSSHPQNPASSSNPESRAPYCSSSPRWALVCPPVVR